MQAVGSLAYPMLGTTSRVPAAIALLGAILGLLFATYSTLDYAAHLDRQLHDVHCSVIPGAPPQAEAEGCRAAMYSAYSAILKGSLWGGVPITLFAQGCFAFLAAFAVFLLVSGPSSSRVALIFFAAIGVTPLIVSIGMFLIAVIQLGELCQTCIGIYISSGLVALGGLLGLAGLRREGSPLRSRGSWILPPVWLCTLAACTLAPSLVYAATAPNHSPYIRRCGTLKSPNLEKTSPVHLVGQQPIMPAVLLEDPLCATCKAVHERLEYEGVLRRLNTELVLFPLDSKCNWMLEHSLHPGACSVSKAILCGNAQSKEVLAWVFDQQEYLLRAGKADEQAKRSDFPTVREIIRRRWGEALVGCMESKATALRLNRHLQFAVDNSIPVSTPQLYLANQRICDEDTDIGLRFTLKHLAPEVAQ